MRYTLLGKWRPFGKYFQANGLSVVHSLYYYSVYNTVGWSITSIYDLGGIFTSVLIYWL